MSNVVSSNHDGDSEKFLTPVASALRDSGYIVLDGVFQTEALQLLLIDIKNRSSDEFHVAGVGRSQGYQKNPFVRRDRICWLSETTPQAAFYFKWMKALQQKLNQNFFLGLNDFECHYAHYPKGAFYKKHLDAFKDKTSRRVTTILYLNPAWSPDNGGELIIYEKDSEQILEKVEPFFGRMVIFLSEDFPHEVLPVNKSRYSLTGWFRNDGQPVVS
ncbi:MAG: 2OG-Fe(II) oxygenase [Gammaproteobacteria bacterium]|nr:2OG-Fe(II) oxygenase [Gammaproteobacteria bacterium]MDH5692688.1 2OG-Fe(II) oxygenase [Gammaproteobacteria bacterium]